MRKSNIIGIDLAKNVFHVCIMNRTGRVLRRHRTSRRQLFDFVVKHCEGVISVEACGGSHYWARRFKEAGFEVRVVPAQFVKPFVKSNKNDEIDAEAICEAASRPQMRFVSVRSEEQQDIQNLHRIRERMVRARTALGNEIRGFLLEYGIVIPKGLGHVRRALPALLEEQSTLRSPLWLRTFHELWEELKALDERISRHEQELSKISQDDALCQRLLEIPGVGELTATAIVAAVGDAKAFKNGRQFAAWLGLTPKQHSTGGKARLGHISKRGDKYLRKLLVQGARSSAIAAARRRNHKDTLKRNLTLTDKWFFKVAGRRGDGRAVVALANKNARRIWTVLAKKQDFKQPEQLLDLAA